MNEFFQRRGTPTRPHMFVVCVRMMFGNLVWIDKLPRDLRNDYNAIRSRGNRPISRREIVARHGQSLLPAPGRPTLGFRVLFGTLSGLGTFSALLRLCSLRRPLDGFPSVLEVVV
jgi:hypothetical protein